MIQSVLIIENDPEALDLLCTHVEECEFRIQCAENLETAMSKMLNHRHSIVIVDWALPDHEAATIIEQIRGNHRIRRTHVIVVSSDANPSIVEAALNAGADDFFSMPIGLVELRARLNWAASRTQTLV